VTAGSRSARLTRRGVVGQCHPRDRSQIRRNACAGKQCGHRQRGRALDDLDAAAFRKFIDVNQVGVFLGRKAVVPSMRSTGGGSVVNISSNAGTRGRHNILACVATKFAVSGISKAAAIAIAADSIRVNSVHPGIIGNTSPKWSTSPSATRTGVRRTC